MLYEYNFVWKRCSAVNRMLYGKLNRDISSAWISKGAILLTYIVTFHDHRTLLDSLDLVNSLLIFLRGLSNPTAWSIFIPTHLLALNTNPIIIESCTITAIYFPLMGYCLFGISLVTHISYQVSCIFLIIMVNWIVLSFADLFTSLTLCTQLGYSTLSTM